MGVCLSKKEQLQCNQAVIDHVEKSTLLRDAMSSPACQMRRFSLDTPRISAEISEMVAVLFHKAASRSSATYCGCSSEKLLPSPEMRRCSSARKHRRSFSFSSRLCCELLKSEAREGSSCKEARINACVHDCCIAIGEENVSITYQMVGSSSSNSNSNSSSNTRRNLLRKHEDDVDDAASPSDGSDDEVGMPGPTNSPERDWKSATIAMSPSLQQNARQKEQDDHMTKTSNDLMATLETVSWAASHSSSWAMSAGEEFFPDWDVGIVETTDNGARKCKNARAAFDEIAVFNAEDYFKEDVDCVDGNHEIISNKSSDRAVDASSAMNLSHSSLFASVSNAEISSGMVSSGCVDDCYCAVCRLKPHCTVQAAEEASLLGSNRSTLSASKNSEASRCKLSKRQRCRQLMESIKLFTTEAHHCFSAKHSDRSASTKPSYFSDPSRCSHGGSISSKPSVDYKTKPGKESIHRQCTEQAAAFSFCKVAAESCDSEANAYSNDPNDSIFSAQPKQCFPAAPSLLDALPAFGTPLTVRNPADPAPSGKYEPATFGRNAVFSSILSPHQPNFVSETRSSSPDREYGENSDSGSDLFEIDNLTPHDLDASCPLSITSDAHQKEDQMAISNALPKFMAGDFGFHSIHNRPFLESTTKASVHHQIDLHCRLQPEFIENY